MTRFKVNSRRLSLYVFEYRSVSMVVTIQPEDDFSSSLEKFYDISQPRSGEMLIAPMLHYNPAAERSEMPAFRSAPRDSNLLNYLYKYFGPPDLPEHISENEMNRTPT